MRRASRCASSSTLPIPRTHPARIEIELEPLFSQAHGREPKTFSGWRFKFRRTYKGWRAWEGSRFCASLFHSNSSCVGKSAQMGAWESGCGEILSSLVGPRIGEVCGNEGKGGGRDGKVASVPFRRRQTFSFRFLCRYFSIVHGTPCHLSYYLCMCLIFGMQLSTFVECTIN